MPSACLREREAPAFSQPLRRLLPAEELRQCQEPKWPADSKACCPKSPPQERRPAAPWGPTQRFSAAAEFLCLRESPWSLANWEAAIMSTKRVMAKHGPAFLEGQWTVLGAGIPASACRESVHLVGRALFSLPVPGEIESTHGRHGEILCYGPGLTQGLQICQVEDVCW